MTKNPRTSAAGPTTAELMTLIVERAPALRAAGVIELAIGDCRVLLAPAADAPLGAPPKPEAVPKYYKSALDDPSTYPGGALPGYTRDEEPRR